MDLDLKDKVATVTGGSVGIGLAIARGLADEGVHLALCARNAERVVEVAREIGDEFGVKAIGVQADMSQADGIEAFVAAVERQFDGAYNAVTHLLDLGRRRIALLVGSLESYSSRERLAGYRKA